MNNGSPYPVEAFPQNLRDPMTAIHEDTQIPVEMIGSTLLAATSLALQSLINVSSPFDREKTEPCSLYFLVLAKSGEGKSPLFELILEPFNAFAAQMQKEYDARMAEYKISYAVWKSRAKALERSLQKASEKGGDSEAEALFFSEHLSAEPQKPRAFEMFYEDATPAGIIEGLNNYPYAGIFSEDAITFFTGPLKSKLGLLNKIWKNEKFSLSRKTEGNIRISAFLTFLLMVQPDVFEEYLRKNGKLALSSGFLPRFLFSPSLSTIGRRTIKLNQDKSKEALSVLFSEFKLFLNLQKNRFYDSTLPLITLTLSDAAKNLFQNKVNQYQENIAPGRVWEHIPEFVSKAGNHAIRIAALFDCRSQDGLVHERTLNNAFTITEWYINQASRYFYSSGKQFQLQQDVYELFDWIKKYFEKPKGKIRFFNDVAGQFQDVTIQPYQPFLKNDLETSGPARLRRAERLMPVLNELIGLGFIVSIQYPPLRSVYIAMPNYDYSGNSYAINPTLTNVIILQNKYTTYPLIGGYDFTRLQW